MRSDLTPRCDPVAGCITCADEGIEMHVVSTGGAEGLTSCADPGGAMNDVDTTLVEPVAPGDLVLVHAGVAIARLEPEELP